MTISNDKIRDELSEYIQALILPDSEITDDSTLQDLNIDSIALVKIFVFIEKQFGISLINAGLSRKDIETFGSLVKSVGKVEEVSLEKEEVSFEIS